jgi:high-affinity iron transporter
MLTYFGLVKIPTRALFATTTILIALLAAGKALHALTGYTAMQLSVYLAILAVTFVLMRLYGSPVKAAQPARG